MLQCTDIARFFKSIPDWCWCFDYNITQCYFVILALRMALHIVLHIYAVGCYFARLLLTVCYVAMNKDQCWRIKLLWLGVWSKASIHWRSARFFSCRCHPCLQNICTPPSSVGGSTQWPRRLSLCRCDQSPYHSSPCPPHHQSRSPLSQQAHAQGPPSR